ncbi:MAG: exodeoxyribonuclease VII small subunit, partial [Gammaproteobacteria bacterium]
TCQSALREAEQKVQVLMSREGGESLEPFESDGDAS